MKNIIAAFLLALGIAVAGVSIACAIYAFKNFDHYVAVKGLAERTVKANDAVWEIRFNAADDNLNAVYQQTTNAQNAIIHFLADQHFQVSDMQRMPIDVQDKQAQMYSSNTDKSAKRYSANAGIVLHTASVDNVIDAQQKISQLLTQGVVISQSRVSYYFTQLNDIKPAMLQEATANAKKAAELFAQNSGNHLGKIRNASQGMFSIDDISQQDYRANSSVMKNVRLVTSVEYFLQ